MKQWKAATDKVIVEAIVGPKQTDTGIVLPDKMKGKVDRGVVIALGPEAHNVRIGDIVIYQTSGAIEVEKNVFSMHVDYVAAIIRTISEDSNEVAQLS